MDTRNKLNPIYLGLVLSCIGESVYSAPVVWTDADFLSPKGHTWVNASNPSNRGDLHIQNTQTA